MAMVNGTGMRRVIALASAVWLAVGVPFAFPGTVSANHTAPCAEAAYHARFRWASKLPGVAPTGARGVTESQALDVCTSATDAIRANHAWVAVDDNGGHENDLVQAGRITCEGTQAVCNLQQHRFWAWGRHNSRPGCAGFSNVLPIAQDLGQWTTGADSFIVARSGGEWKVFLNGSYVNGVAEGSICWAKIRALWAGETWDIGDAMGGSAGNKYALTQAAYQTAVAGAWLNPGFTAGAQCENNPDVDPPYKCVTPSNNALSIWTEH